MPHLYTGILEIHADRLQHLCSDSSTLSNQAEKDLLCTYKVVSKSSCFFLCKHDNLQQGGGGGTSKDWRVAHHLIYRIPY